VVTKLLVKALKLEVVTKLLVKALKLEVVTKLLVKALNELVVTKLEVCVFSTYPNILPLNDPVNDSAFTD